MSRKTILEAIEPLLTRGFVMVKDAEVPENFGDTEIVLASPAIRLRFLSDRGQTFVQAQEHTGGWYDIREILRAAHVGEALGPWDQPEEAVRALEDNRALVEETLRDPAQRGRLTARD